jgi:hypothetical protein
VIFTFVRMLLCGVLDYASILFYYLPAELRCTSAAWQVRVREGEECTPRLQLSWIWVIRLWVVTSTLLSLILLLSVRLEWTAILFSGTCENEGMPSRFRSVALHRVTLWTSPNRLTEAPWADLTPVVNASILTLTRSGEEIQAPLGCDTQMTVPLRYYHRYAITAPAVPTDK